MVIFLRKPNYFVQSWWWWWGAACGCAAAHHAATHIGGSAWVLPAPTRVKLGWRSPTVAKLGHLDAISCAHGGGGGGGDGGGGVRARMAALDYGARGSVLRRGLRRARLPAAEIAAAIAAANATG